MTPAPNLTGDGNWLQILRRPASSAPRPALFLDRDGVVVEHVEYLHRIEDVRMIDAMTAAIAAANAAGWLVVMATNQSGVGRGTFGWPEFDRLQRFVLDRLAAGGATLDMVLACPFHRDAQPPYRRHDHPWRKPRPGMLLEASRRLPIALARSWIVGDRAIDMEAGRAARLAGGVHIGADPADRAAAQSTADGGYAVICCADAAAARLRVAELVGGAS